MHTLAQNVIRKARVSALRIAFQHLHFSGRVFRCLICQYEGPSMPSAFGGSSKLHPLSIGRAAQIAEAGLRQSVRRALGSQRQDIVAPDPITNYLRSKFGQVICADISRGKDRIVLDMRAIEMEDASVDAVFASHVLEHIREDETALREVHRVMNPDGSHFAGTDRQ